MELTNNEKEYLLAVLESSLADCEGLEEWEDYRTCETLIAKISQSEKGNDRQNEIEKVKVFIEANPNYTVSNIQRLLMKGYIYCVRLLEEIGKR